MIIELQIKAEKSYKNTQEKTIEYSMLVILDNRKTFNLDNY